MTDDAFLEMTDDASLEATFEREARTIARAIRETGVELPNGTTARAGFISVDDELQIKVRNGLYSGQLGIAVYFAAMYAVLGDEEYERFARSVVTPLLEASVDELLDEPYIGVGSGVGSTVYGLTLLAQLTGDQRYEDRAGDVVDALSASTIVEDEQYDILLGTAGTLTGLLAYYERSEDPKALERATTCGKYLLENRYEKWNAYHIWDTSMVNDALSTSTGMGHGVSGIVSALYRLYGHTEREAFREAADDALAFENLFYSEYQRNWKANFSGVEHYTDRWCSGRVGIGLARLTSLESHSIEPIERDLRRAEQGLDPALMASDSLCHGTFGQVDFLVELGRRGDETALERARTLAATAIERKRETGHYSVANEQFDGISNPVLFLGTAGIGYELLRLLEPESIPSVLRFE